MSAFRCLEDADVRGKPALIRVDFNTPMKDGEVSDDTRLRTAKPTIDHVRELGGKAVLAAHFGRPKGERREEMSLRQVLPALERVLGTVVAFADDCIGPEAERAVAALPAGGVLLLENTRFHKGEEANDTAFSQALANLADIYVNDAFSAAHRAHGSTEGVAHLLPAYAGLAMARELDHLDKALGAPERPVIAVVGGAKVSTKIDLLNNLVARVDALVIGGGMANTFLAAQGKPVGASLCEHDLADTARGVLDKAKAAGCDIILPVDAVFARKFEAHADHRTGAADSAAEDEMVLDAGPRTVAAIETAFQGAKTLIWNGPLGAFELLPFDAATVVAAKAAARLARSGALTAVAGGGDTVAALAHAGVKDDFSFVSTAGGAFLEWMEGKDLPGIAVLMG